MSKLRFLTAGESHGPGLSIIVEGMIAGLELLPEDINSYLKKRQGGYGRGGRMKIETDTVQFTGGVRHGLTMGGPISMQITNRDHQKWLDVMNPEPLSDISPDIQEELDKKYISRVRPGHADFAGAIKYNHKDVRNVLERSSARETTSRVAAGSVARKLLQTLGISIYSHVIRIGEVSIDNQLTGSINQEEYELIENSPVRCKDKSSEEKMIQHIDAARSKGETLGGMVELIVYGMPIGIGSYTHWDRRLDGLIAQSLMSIHTAKSVEIGCGQLASQLPGSQIHDEITVNKAYNALSNYQHLTNRAGGIEGGMSNGEPIICRVALKPIPTLARRPEDSLKSIDLQTQSDDVAFYERSDVCVVPAGGIVCESMLAFTLAEQILNKFGGDSLHETQTNYNNYIEYCKSR